MRQRCNLITHKSYCYYGGRGIKVCVKWQNNFRAFLADVGNPPTPQHTLDRINNDGDYEPTNIRWATREEQEANKSLKP